MRGSNNWAGRVQNEQGRVREAAAIGCPWREAASAWIGIGQTRLHCPLPSAILAHYISLLTHPTHPLIG